MDWEEKAKCFSQRGYATEFDILFCHLPKRNKWCDSFPLDRVDTSLLSELKYCHLKEFI
jgi:hypothetical protein